MKKKWYVTIILAVLLVLIFSISTILTSIARDFVINTFKIPQRWFMQVALIADIIPITIFLLLARFGLKYDMRKIWLRPEKLVKNYAVGYLVGAVLFCAFIGVAILTRTINYAGRSDLPVLDILLFLPAFAIQSFNEELLARGLLQRLFKDQWGFWPSILLPGIIFALLHVANQGTSILSIVILLIVSVLFALMVYVTESLWFAAAAHAAWNYAQGPLFGFNVSGSKYGGSWLKFDTIGKSELLTGGKYGPEGSLIVAGILLIAAIVFYMLLCKKKRDVEQI